MAFPNRAGSHPDTDDVLAAELASAGIKVTKLEFLREKGEVKTAIRGHLHGWHFERAWYYWCATGPGLDVDTAERLWKDFGVSVRVGGHGASPSPREHYKGLGCGDYHVDDQAGLNALSAAITSLVEASMPVAYAEGNDVGEEIEKKFLLKSDDWRGLVSHSGVLTSSPT